MSKYPRPAGVLAPRRAAGCVRKAPSLGLRGLHPREQIFRVGLPSRLRALASSLAAPAASCTSQSFGALRNPPMRRTEAVYARRKRVGLSARIRAFLCEALGVLWVGVWDRARTFPRFLFSPSRRRRGGCSVLVCAMIDRLSGRDRCARSRRALMARAAITALRGAQVSQTACNRAVRGRFRVCRRALGDRGRWSFA